MVQHMNRIPTILCTALLCAVLMPAEGAIAAEPGCDATEIDNIVRAIQLPEIPDRNFNIVDFGAAEGGVEDARPAILAAIDAAVEQGGGRVVVPAGLWRLAPQGS